MTVTADNSSAEFVPDQDFGDRVRMIRRRVKLNQADFADAVGVPKGSIGAWETGETAATLKQKLVANSIQSVFGVPVWWTLGLPDPRSDDAVTVTREYPSLFSHPIRLASVATVASLEQFRSKRSA